MSANNTPNTTVSCALVGVWPGAQVIHTDGRVGIVVATGELAGQPCAWATFGAGVNSVPEPACHSVQALALDLTHRMTRLEVMARLAERAGLDASGGAWWRGSVLFAGGRSRGFEGHPMRFLAADDVLVEGLYGLHVTDDTRLPDGARLVDIQALALVVAHVFGGPV